MGLPPVGCPESMLPEYQPRGMDIRQPHQGRMLVRAMSQGHAYDGNRDVKNVWKSNQDAEHLCKDHEHGTDW
jgi:hypothetical protein